MNKSYCVNGNGECLVVWKNDNGVYCCPICGSPEFEEPPYDSEGNASFQMCSCGFEFGFDDSPLASSEAVDGVENNWDRWRLKVIEKCSNSKPSLEKLMANLKNIDIELAFDLIPVKKCENT